MDRGSARKKTVVYPSPRLQSVVSAHILLSTASLVDSRISERSYHIMGDYSRPDDHAGAPLGVLFTGHMEKKNPASFKGNQWEKRFLVLTYDAFYWFRRRENYELFGEERGHIYLKDLLSVRALHDDDHQFELTDKSKNSRYFRPIKGNLDDQHSIEQTEEWITAIRSAMTHLKATSMKDPKAEVKGAAPRASIKPRKRGSITMKKFVDPQKEEERRMKESQVKVQMLSVLSGGVEVVIARNPEWQEIMTLPPVDYHDNDEFIVSTSNGGSVKLTKRLLEDKCTVIANSEGFGTNPMSDDEDDLRSIAPSSPSAPKRPSRRSSASEKYKNRLKVTLAKGFREVTSSNETAARNVPNAGSVVAGAGGNGNTSNQNDAGMQRPRNSSAASAVEALFRQTASDGSSEVTNKCFSVKVEGVPLPCSVYMFAFRDATLDYLEDRKAENNSSSSLMKGLQFDWKATMKSDAVILLVLLVPYLAVANELIKSAPTVTDPARALVALGGVNLAAPPTWIVYSILLLCMSIAFPRAFRITRRNAGDTGGRSRARTLSADLNSPVAGLSYRLVLLGYSFTSEENPVEQRDNELPKRYMNCEPTLEECRRRWDLTRHWRETEGINKILQEPQPYFHYMKYYYPHYHAGKGREGHVVFYERPGELNLKELSALGLDNDALLRHWIFNTEYQWELLCGGDDEAQSISIIDVKGVSVFDLMGSTLDFVRKTIGIANKHYPDRAYRVYIINATTTFTTIFSLVKRVISAATLEKIKVCGQTGVLETLQESIDIDQIPDYYGGTLRYEGVYAGPDGKDSCRYFSHENVGQCNFVHAVPGVHFDGFDHTVHPTVADFKREQQEGRLSSEGVTTQPSSASISPRAENSSTIKSPPPQVQTFLQREQQKNSDKRISKAGTPRTPLAAGGGDVDDGISDLSVSPASRLFYNEKTGGESMLFRDSPAPSRGSTPRSQPTPLAQQRRSKSERIPGAAVSTPGSTGSASAKYKY